MVKQQKAGIYVHIPFCRRKCNYCDFYLITNQKLIEKYLSSLNREIEISARGLKTIFFDTLFIGGGTPSLLKSKYIEKIISSISDSYNFSPTEITIEVNPEDIRENVSLLWDYKSMGINRLSIGIQSFNDEELKTLSRWHTSKEAVFAVETALKLFENVSIDIIYSLPHQQVQDVIETLKTTVSLKVPHISAYTLIFEENTKLFLNYRMGRVTRNQDELESELYLAVSEFLTDNEYEHYEVSNYAKEGYRSKHNLKYWLGSDYLGFGPSAHSLINGYRWNNFRNIVKYNIAISENKLPRENQHRLTEREKKLEYIMLHLRSLGIEFKEYKYLFGADFLTEYKEATDFILKNNLGNYNSSKFYLNSKGYALLDEILVEYF